MAGSFSVTISNLSGLNAGTLRAEASELKWVLDTGLQKLVSSQATSVTLTDRNGNNVGSMSWTQVNTR